MRITSKDVAREAGVSVATVSRVFNNSGPVRTATRERIQEVARVLRYSPHGAARSLITNKTSTIGVLLPDLYGEFFSEVIRGIDQTARQSAYHVLLSSAHQDKPGIEAALRAMRGRVDGLIVMSPDLDAAGLADNLPSFLPAVLLNCALAGEEYDSLTIDNRGGAADVVRHLLSLGHRRIAIIRGPERNHDAAERLRGWREALAGAGVRPEAALEAHGDFTESGGYAAAVHLLRESPRPTAIFAANDSMAIGALSALRERGIAVPREMAIAGFDDIPIARYLSPPLTSVHVDIEELGARAMRLLLDALEDRSPVRRQETLGTRLVVRGSCGSERHG